VFWKKCWKSSVEFEVIKKLQISVYDIQSSAVSDLVVLHCLFKVQKF
jgi:hypothetical protein